MQANNSILQPQSAITTTENDVQTKTTTLKDVGQTWSNAGPLNIDLDNLLSTKSKSNSSSLSMNQLKLQSPVKSQQPALSSGLNTPPSLHINNNLTNNSFNTINNNNFSATILSPAQQNHLMANTQQQQSQSALFADLMPNLNPSANNLNNQFNAFQ